MVSSSNDPAGQESGVQGEIGPSTFQLSKEDESIFVHSLSHTEISDGALQQPGSYTEASELNTHMETVEDALQCGEIFPKRHLKYAIPQTPKLKNSTHARPVVRAASNTIHHPNVT